MHSKEKSILLAQKLIKSKSVTPKDDGAMNTLKKSLSKIGFKNRDLPFGSKENNDLILYLFSIKKTKKKLKKKVKYFALLGIQTLFPQEI
jgi:hypothetical protein